MTQMWALGKDNWIEYGWGSNLSCSWVPDTSLRINYRTSKNSALTPIDEAIRTVNEIVASYPAPYTLMCSGGADSQAMIYAWHKSGHPFKIVSFIYTVDGRLMNFHDHVELEKFCTQYDLDVQYEKYDIVEFLENRLVDVSQKYDCDSPQICTYIDMSEAITNGTILFSGNFIDHGYSASLNFTLLGLHRYAEAANSTTRAVIPFFFCHDKDLAISFISKFENVGKERLYQLGGFPVIPQKQKFNGFELLKKHYDQFQDRISSAMKLRYAGYPSNRVFDLLFRYPLYTGRGKSAAKALEFLLPQVS